MDRLISEKSIVDVLSKGYWDKNLQSAKDDPCVIDAMIDWAIRQVKAIPSAEPKWIPMTTRPMTEEEQEHYREWFDFDGAMIFDCELPEDGQEVLVSYGGYVCVDTFCKDDGCYFEGVDIDDVTAWMPLPKPYEPQEKRCEDCNHYGKFSLDCARCDDDCSMYEPQEISDRNLKMWEEIFKAESEDKE